MNEAKRIEPANGPKTPLRKEGEVSEADKKATVAEFSLGKGMAVAVACGVMSASMAYGIGTIEGVARRILAR